MERRCTPPRGTKDRLFVRLWRASKSPRASVGHQNTEKFAAVAGMFCWATTTRRQHLVLNKKNRRRYAPPWTLFRVPTRVAKAHAHLKTSGNNISPYPTTHRRPVGCKVPPKIEAASARAPRVSGPPKLHIIPPRRRQRRKNSQTMSGEKINDGAYRDTKESQKSRGSCYAHRGRPRGHVAGRIPQSVSKRHPSCASKNIWEQICDRGPRKTRQKIRSAALRAARTRGAGENMAIGVAIVKYMSFEAHGTNGIPEKGLVHI
ncbi:hypothetical protein C8J57DRAFT_1252455 [Mycena rebaudengoi]|nr:hypothetical protein C8J57DRAFT_1252455 [Mycena rebaudengoi]